MHQEISVRPVEVGIMSGILGAGAGYIMAPRKYNLEQLLTQKADVFEKTLNLEKMKSATKEQNAAYTLIVNARKCISNSSNKGKVAEFLQQSSMEKSYKHIKKLLPKARVQNAIVCGSIAAIMGTLAKVVIGDNG